MLNKKSSNIIEKLKKKQLCFQTTILHDNDFKCEKFLNKSFYFGIDPSSSEIHIGHILNLMLAKQLHKIGMKMLLVIGTFTVKIGDPSMREKVRENKPLDNLNNNSYLIAETIVKILNKLDIYPKILYNNQWLDNLQLSKYVEILKFFNIQHMLNSTIFQKRLKENNPIFAHELAYKTFQAYDYLHLYKYYDCILQIGGQDQWSNMVAGCYLIRKYHQEIVNVITVPLLSDSSGLKISKTSKNSHLYSINVNKSYFYNYINLEKIELNTKNILSKAMESDNITLEIFKLIHSEYEYKLCEIITHIDEFITEKDKQQVLVLVEYLDKYNKNNLNLKILIRKFTNITKSHNISDAIISGSIIINGKKINSINAFYINVLEGVNFIRIKEYKYMFVFNI